MWARNTEAAFINADHERIASNMIMRMARKVFGKTHRHRGAALANH
jgi:hypothetical protein